MISSGGAVVGDLRVTAQVRVPDHRLDAVGHAARDAAAQHAAARIVPEIYVDDRPRDAHERYALDAEREQRNQSPQRGKLRFREAIAAGRGPGRVDAIHLADDARRPEAVNEG